MTRILVSTGDHSADIHGESLVKEMKMIDPSLQISALGGTKLKSVANDFIRNMVDLDVSGFSQPFRQFFTLKNIPQKSVFPKLTSHSVDAVILIDYYGFNIHIAKKAKEENIPVFYFVSPQVWASRKRRIEKLKKFVTIMLVIFPFEEELYKKHGVPVEFVGHPLMDSISKVKIDSHKTGVLNGKIKLGLMPGSRQRELERHIPLLIKSYVQLKKKFKNIEATLFQVDYIPDHYYDTLIQQTIPNINEIAPLNRVRELSYEKRAELTLSLTASGTATLENALLGIPMIVIYQTSWLTYWVAKKIIQVPYISMPNILSGKEIIPELIQHHATPDTVSQAASEYFSKPELLEKMRGDLANLKERLGPPGAYQRAAKSILEKIR